MNEITLKSTIDNLPFKVHRNYIENPDIIARLDANEDIVIETALPAKILTKLAIQLKLSSKTPFSTVKPVGKDFSLDILSSTTKSLVQEITKEESYIKQLMDLQSKLSLKNLTELIGFIIAYFLREKDENEVNAFFNLESDLSDHDIEAVKSTMKDLNINF